MKSFKIQAQTQYTYSSHPWCTNTLLKDITLTTHYCKDIYHILIKRTPPAKLQVSNFAFSKGHHILGL